MIVGWHWPSLRQSQISFVNAFVSELLKSMYWKLVHLISEYMKTNEYQRSRSLFDLCTRLLRYVLSNIWSKTTEPIKAKFHMEPLWVGGMKVYSNDPAHVTNMATVPMYGKNYLKVFSGTKRLMSLKLGIQHQELWVSKFVQMMILGWPWPFHGEVPLAC